MEIKQRCMYLNNLQSYAFAIVLFLFTCFIACEQGQEVVKQYQISEKLKLKEGDKITLAQDSQQITLLLSKVAESRCPINAECIRAGEAVTTFIFSDAEKQEYPLEMSFGERSHFKPDTSQININNHNYRVILENVLPYPKLGVKQTKTAELYIEEL